MPILDLQRRLVEIGRIRIGEQVDTVDKYGKPTKKPVKLDKFRLTSRDKHVIEMAAQMWGGTPQPWDSPDGPQFEVYTAAQELKVVVPPESMSFSQWMETWSKAGCIKRCDGRWDVVRDTDCDCNPEDRECKYTTRLSLVLPDIPSLGLFRLETHSYNAALELAGAVNVCQTAGAQGVFLPARLRLDARSKVKIINGKPQTLRYCVPVLNVDSLPALVGGAPNRALTIGGDGPAVTPAGPNSQSATSSSQVGSWQPVGELPEPPMISVADQMAELDREVKPRKNAAGPIKPTGLKPRGATADPGTCDLCGEPYAVSAVKRNPGTGSRFVHVACLAGGVEAAGQGASDGRGGMDSGRVDRIPTAEPAPAANPPAVVGVATTESSREISSRFPRKSSGPSAAQRSKMYALAGEVFEIPPTETTQERERLQRAELLALCTELGRPGLTSRTEIDTELCSDIIDALEACKAGTLVWDGEHLIAAEQATTEPPQMIDPATGEILT